MHGQGGGEVAQNILSALPFEIGPLSLSPRPPPFCFVFTIMHGIGEKLKRGLPVYYCEHKRKVKAGEAWKRGSRST